MPKGYSAYLKAIENAAQQRRDMRFFGYFTAKDQYELQAAIEPLELTVRGYGDRLRPILASRILRGVPEAPVILQVGRSYRGEHIWKLQLLWAGERPTMPEELDREIRKLLSKPGSELIYSNPEPKAG